jgi:hypothetical protein
MNILVLIAQLAAATMPDMGAADPHASANNWSEMGAKRVTFKEECTISWDFHVAGDKPLRCVEFLESKAKLARAEMRVNNLMQRKAKR